MRSPSRPARSSTAECQRKIGGKSPFHPTPAYEPPASASLRVRGEAVVDLRGITDAEGRGSHGRRGDRRGITLGTVDPGDPGESEAKSESRAKQDVEDVLIRRSTLAGADDDDGTDDEERRESVYVDLRRSTAATTATPQEQRESNPIRPLF